jgi:hypothetical protein
MEALILVATLGGPTMMARIGMMRALNHRVTRSDAANSSCCGEADAYWADEIHYRDGKTYAVITDDRPDEPRGRPHVAPGTEVEVPNSKLKWDRSNPTGHGVVFISRQGGDEWQKDAQDQRPVFDLVLRHLSRCR